MKKIIISILIMSSLLLGACSSASSDQGSIFNSIPQEQQCTEHSDCVAAVCCHAAESVHKDYAPDCSGILCSADCQEGTMDCGQGRAKCVQGACTVVPVE